jgi:SpoVK/Ycf46/Vps4 family AAA+-type ATPase
LTDSEASNALAKAVVQAGGVLSSSAVETVTAEKKQIIRKSGLLEYYDNTELIEHVGGLTTLKGWLRKRVRAFTDEARAFGLPAPKGILLVGVQGCGKSLIARSVAGMWRLPLLRLDAGRLFSRWWVQARKICVMRFGPQRALHLRCCGWTRLKRALRASVRATSAMLGPQRVCLEVL